MRTRGVEVFPAPDVGVAEFPHADTAVIDFPSVDSVVVDFPPPPIPIIEGVAHFTGTGRLSISVLAIGITAPEFMGEGMASAGMYAFGGVKELAAAFTGNGEASMELAVVLTADFSSEGAATSMLVPALEAAFTGGGTTSVALSATAHLDAGFGSEGTTNAVMGVEGGAFPVAANFSGNGDVVAQIVPVQYMAAGYSSAGTLSADMVEIQTLPATFTGAGQFSVQTAPALDAEFSGAGSATADMELSEVASAGMQKSGVYEPTVGRSRVTGWAVKDGYAGSVIFDNKLVVAGAGEATITGYVERATIIGMQAWLCVNDIAVATGTAPFTLPLGLTLTATVALNAGDTVSWEMHADLSGVPRIIESSYITIAPA
ncbi:hypothetical protein [Rhodococcus marinonascens]|uniref:hypothetical protein n=1 Tax=Rhodococcus marinonascens TaxID=38311 RepID=UPI000AF2E305|nr:hypothetical protein [Rhodococcus marinonascens]